jgi:hypothetical protein
MLSKSTYVTQPYNVGNKERKSLAIIIPAKVAREYNISSSTIFAIHVNNHRNIVLQMLEMPHTDKASEISLPDNKSSRALIGEQSCEIKNTK